MNFLSKFTQSEISLIATNVLFPLIGTLLFGWTLLSILFYYWLENVIVGFYNVVKMFRATGTSKIVQTNRKKSVASSNSKVALILFFLVHYGIFTYVHGIFVVGIFSEPMMSFNLPIMSKTSLLLGLLSLMITHGISYYFNFIKNGTYTQISAADLFIYPYPRVIVLHLVLLLGALPVLFLGAPFITLLLLIALKTYIDLRLQRYEQKKLATAINSDTRSDRANQAMAPHRVS